ncbi:T-complex protein 1 subunit beta [Panicum miliaceum]|uniref:T-complex protein 1 subunit beta n=1 Tax=Panicum miliaceum TaxID=4540 RepID=A0A3L6R047_PANMI|nr:T-complex protein 1 subunit beta [Panicum miliaceum]
MGCTPAPAVSGLFWAVRAEGAEREHKGGPQPLALPPPPISKARSSAGARERETLALSPESPASPPASAAAAAPDLPPLLCLVSAQMERLLKDDAIEEKGERARMASFVGAMAIADLVKTTLGPKGMDKILQSTGRGRSVTVTNDGATILKSLHIDNPAAKVLVDISKVQDDEVGDGTTSVVVLAGELLREAEKLVNMKIHPMTIIAGFRMALECARNALLQRTMDNKENTDKFRADLMNIAMTTLSSKILSQDKEYFAELAVDAVLRLKGSTNLEAIQILKKPGGSLKDSFLDEGFILDKKIGIGQPKRIENAKILVANTAMDTDKVKIYGARVRVDSMSKVADIEAAEKQKMREKVQKIIAHGINCFVNRQLIYNFPEELFADAGILAIEHADFEGIERLALVTGGEIASTFDNPESVKLGHCKVIEEIMIGEDRLIHFSGVEMGQACTIVLRGASEHVLDEAERSLHDALCVLSQTVNDTRVLFGGGWPEMVMAKEVDELARKTPGKKSHAIDAFSRALQAIPTTIADNAGLDSAELISQLRAEHHKENCTAGIDVITGSVGDMQKLGIQESFKVKQAILLSATEAAEMILRVDEIITCAPRRREDRM